MESKEGGNIILQKEVKLKNPLVIGGFMNQTPLGVMVTSYIVESLKMHQVGIMKSPYIPPVTVFVGRKMRNPFRIYSNEDGTLLIVQSEVPVRQDGLAPLSEVLLGWLKTQGISEFVVVDGIPTRELGERDTYLVAGANRISELEKKKIEIAESAIISGIGGAILNESLMSNVNALALLTMHAMEIPDPDSVLSIIKALNSIYNLKIHTAVLEESVKRLHEQINKISEEYKASKGEDADNSMYK